MQMRNDGKIEESDCRAHGNQRQPTQDAGGVSQCLTLNIGLTTSPMDLCSHLNRLRILVVKSQSYTSGVWRAQHVRNSAIVATSAYIHSF